MSSVVLAKRSLIKSIQEYSGSSYLRIQPNSNKFGQFIESAPPGQKTLKILNTKKESFCPVQVIEHENLQFDFCLFNPNHIQLIVQHSDQRMRNRIIIDGSLELMKSKLL